MNYLFVNPGSGEKTYKYSWFLSQNTQQPTSFLVDKTKVLINFHANQDSDATKRGFRILLKQHGL